MKSTANNQEDKVGWILKKVEEATAPFLESRTAFFTVKSLLAQLCENRMWRVVLGTPHHFRPLRKTKSVSADEAEQ